MDKIIQLAKKLKALADRGVDGEKINAEKMLQKIMKQHNLSMEDVEGEKKERAYFKVDKLQEQIFYQVVTSVVGSDYDSYTNPHKRGKIILLVTASEAIEIQMKYDFFWKLYHEELLIFRHAFIVKNRIFHPEGKTIDMDELSPEEKERHQRVSMMAESIRKGELNKQLKK